MKIKGGNTKELYRGDGRLKMACSLERQWPRVVTVGRRFKRPQHVVHKAWRNFDTPLKLKPGIDLEKLRGQRNEYNMELVEMKSIKVPEIKKLIKVYNKNKGEPRASNKTRPKR